MVQARNFVTIASIVVAVSCAAWAIYATKHSDAPNNGYGPPPGAAASAPRGPAGAPPGVKGSPPVAVVTAPVTKERVARELKALGTAVANESIDVTSKVSNIVTAVKFSDGQSVTRGQILVELDGAQVRAELAVAQAAVSESTSQYNRTRELLSTKVVSQSQYEQLEATMKADRARVQAAEAKLADSIIRAPFAGRVGLRRVSVGSLVNPGTVITTLDDTSVVKVDFSVPENLIGGLRAGLPIVARSTAYTDRQFIGKVASIDSRVDATTRSVTVRAEVPNPGSLLKPGMFLNVALSRDERDVLVVPEQAMVPEQSRQFVYVVENDVAVKREVRIGRRDPGKVEIVAGLDPGERVIVEGTQKIREGSAVRDVPAASAGREAQVAPQSPRS